MANNSTPKLRAFVRIDGSGRVVPGAPIFQAFKPKVGQWREIPLYYRGDNPSTTTTTTTTAPAGLQIKWQNPAVSNACNSTDYVSATFDNTFLTATAYTGNFQSILDSGLNIGQVVALSYNGEFRVNIIIQSATQLIAQESSWGASC